MVRHPSECLLLVGPGDRPDAIATHFRQLRELLLGGPGHSYGDGAGFYRVPHSPNAGKDLRAERPIVARLVVVSLANHDATVTLESGVEHSAKLLARFA